MRYPIKSSKKLLLAAVLSFTVSACGVPAPPRTVSDICLIDQRLSVAPAATNGVDDPGNKLDTDETVVGVLKHNAKLDEVCQTSGGPVSDRPNVDNK